MSYWQLRLNSSKLENLLLHNNEENLSVKSVPLNRTHERQSNSSFLKKA